MHTKPGECDSFWISETSRAWETANMNKEENWNAQKRMKGIKVQ